jgi:molybdate transport system substrate-binding protein
VGVKKVWTIGLVLAMAVVSCGRRPALGGEPHGHVLVSAAASLTDAFKEMKLAFEAENPNLVVELNFAGSSSLREQILEGAPVDVFASANTGNMGQVVDAGGVAGEPTIFTRNMLEIAVPVGNPGGVEGLDDFANPKLLIGLCAAAVPCGDFARQALRRAGVTPAIDTNEPDVRALLTKIEAGELDAGITYVTDVASSGGAAQGIDIPPADNIIAEYPIAVLAHAPNPRAASQFVAFVLSTGGQALLARYGFVSP